MLIQDLYTVKNTELTDNTLKSVISINPNHKIFEGHFPENPVLPGVVQLQIVKELIEKELNKSLVLKKGSNIKYTSIIVPKLNDELQLTIGITFIENTIKVNTIIKNNDSIFLKFRGVYTEIK